MDMHLRHGASRTVSSSTKKRVHIPSTSPILQDILYAIHDATHEGLKKTLHRFRQTFHTYKAKQTIQQFVNDCGMPTQQNKTPTPRMITSTHANSRANLGGHIYGFY